MPLKDPGLARNKSLSGSVIMGVPATFHVGRDLNAKSKPGSWNCGMLDRDSFMIHSVNIYLAHSARPMLGTLCMLADAILPITLKLLISLINRDRNCDSERWSNLPKVTWLIGSWNKTLPVEPVLSVSTKLCYLLLRVSVKWCLPSNSQLKWHVTATTCHLLAALRLPRWSYLIALRPCFLVCEMKTLYWTRLFKVSLRSKNPIYLYIYPSTHLSVHPTLIWYLLYTRYWAGGHWDW